MNEGELYNMCYMQGNWLLKSSKKTIHLQYSFNAKQFLAQLKFLLKLQTMLQFPNSTAVRPPAVTMEMVQHAEDEWASNDCLNFCKKVNCMYFFYQF